MRFESILLNKIRPSYWKYYIQKCMYVLKIVSISMPKFYTSILIFHNNMSVHSEIQTYILNSNGFYGNALMNLLEPGTFDKLIFDSVSPTFICAGGWNIKKFP